MRRESCDSDSSPEPAALLFGGGLLGEGLVRRAGCAHSVRRESCNSDSSPGPAAAWSEGGIIGRTSSRSRVTGGTPEPLCFGTVLWVESNVFDICLGLWEISQNLIAYEHYESSSAWDECGGGHVWDGECGGWVADWVGGWGV